MCVCFLTVCLLGKKQNFEEEKSESMVLGPVSEYAYMPQSFIIDRCPIFNLRNINKKAHRWLISKYFGPIISLVGLFLWKYFLINLTKGAHTIIVTIQLRLMKTITINFFWRFIGKLGAPTGIIYTRWGVTKLSPWIWLPLGCHNSWMVHSVCSLPRAV